MEEGSSDKSFGIHVAEFAKFPPAVVEAAKRNAAAAASAVPWDAQAEQGDGGGPPAAKRARAPADEAALRAALLDFAALPLGPDAEAGEATRALHAWQENAAALLGRA